MAEAESQGEYEEGDEGEWEDEGDITGDEKGSLEDYWTMQPYIPKLVT